MKWLPKVLVGLLVVVIFLLVQKDEIKKQGVEIPKIIQERVSELTKEPTEYLVSYRMDQEFFDTAYQNAQKLEKPNEQPTDARFMIVPHHLVGADYIAENFSAHASKKISTVVLLSPDHFGQLHSSFGTTELPWKTPYGFLFADTKKIADIASTVKINDRMFDFEHGISDIVPFIKKSFPNAKIIPITVADSAKFEDVKQIASLLHLDDDTMVIGSFDFSHYLPQQVANYHDTLAQTVLETKDSARADRLDIDSKPGLALFLELVKNKEKKERGVLSWHQLRNMSANIIANNPDSFENTTYFTGSFGSGEKITEKKATITVFGDVMLDRRVRKTLDEKGSAYPLLKMERFMMGSDRVIANLEGPFTDNKSVAQPNVLVFTFDPKHAATLKKFGITSVSLANNHTLNFGEKGLQKTHEVLKKNGIAYFGDPSNKTEISYVEEVGGLKIAHVGYHQFASGFENVLTEIKRLRPLVDYILVYPHWGEEYETTKPTTRSQKEAHAFIDVGADVILGGHPHVVQPLEIYKNKMIVYSMGNFIFDQQFSEDVKTGLSVGLVLGENTIQYNLFPIEHNDMQISLSGARKRDTLLSGIANNSVVSEEIKKQIREGVVNITK